MEEVVASAPGKVLITGGYLILERPNAGLVLSTTARFYAIVRPLYEDIKPDSWAWSWTDVTVVSPQLSREATYKLSLKDSTLQCTSSGASANPFVEQAVQYCVAASKTMFSGQERKDALQKLLLHGLHITILGGNDFYSYRNQIEEGGLPLTSATLSTIPAFSSITLNEESGRCKPEVAKTGLGSSAAMTTSVVAALLHYLGAVNLPFAGKKFPLEDSGDSNLDLVHIIAQSAHCIAQGKVGSGFDVSAAVYGSQRYIRFSPSLLSSAQAGGKHFPDAISDILDEKWDHERSKFSLPPLMTLLLGEPGTGGSSTPSMVGSVKRWQKNDPQRSLEIWRKLTDANLKLESQFKILNKFASEQWEAYKQIIGDCSGHVHDKWIEHVADEYQESIVKPLLGAREAFLEIRSHMQEMGKGAGVPIEPESQTQLLDATMNMEGVLLAGVPGAGGFDAVFAIILGETTDAVSKAWSSQGVLPLLVREDPRGVSLESIDPRNRELMSAVSTVKLKVLGLCLLSFQMLASRPADIKLAKGILLEATPNEVFYSFHKDVIAAASLLHPCKVAFLRKGVELPSGISSFICNRVYDIENKCLWWLTDQDYINERQEEVDKLLDKTRLEMHAAVQSGGRSPKPLNGPTSSQQLKSSCDSVQNSGTSSSQASKGKKRERSSDRGTEPIKRERISNKAKDVESASSRLDNTIKSELAKITEKGALIASEGCKKLVQLMQLDRNEKKVDLATRILLADVIAGTDKVECLSRIVQLRGIPILDDWLQGAHKGKTGDGSSPKENDKGSEDLLFALLGALEKLPVNLNALQTCNIGKSVNNLRSHKNLEIQKKARSLVDMWKKRVDAEMVKFNDAKSDGPTNQATMKTLISQPSVYNKPQVNNKLGHVEAIVKSTPVTSGPSKVPSSPMPSSVAVSFKNSPAKGVGGSGNYSELPLATVQEEKSSNSSQSQNNSQSCSSDHGKTLGSSLKEDARSSPAGSLSASKTSGSSSRHRRLSNGHVGNSITGVQKDSNLGKTVKGTNQSGLSSESAHDTPHGSDQGNIHRLIVRIPGRSPARSTSGGSLEDPSTTGSRASSPCIPDRFDLHNDRKVKLKDDACRSHISTDVKAESWQSNVVKEGIIVSDEGNGSPPADLDEESGKAMDSSLGNGKGVSSVVKIKLRNSLFALMDSCSKDSEPSASLSSGDDIGMNLLASVAAGELSKSDSLSPYAPPGSSPKEEKPCASPNEVKPRFFCEVGAAQGRGQSVDDADSDSEKPLADGEKLNEISKVEVKSEDIKEEELESDLAHRLAMEERKPSGRNLEKITEGTPKSSDLVGNLMGDKFKNDPQNVVLKNSSLSAPTGNEEHKPSVEEIEENNVGAADGICRGDSTPSTSDKIPCLETDDASKSKSYDKSKENHLDPCESKLEKLAASAPSSNDQQSGSTSNRVDKILERREGLENHLVSSVPEAEKCSKSDLDRREEFTSSEQDIVGSKLDFDLNEGFSGDDGNQHQIEPTVSSVAPLCSPPIHLPPLPSFASGLTPNASPAPITIAAPNKGPFLPPENLLKTKGEPFGWKGSAATSAFRPAEPRKVLEMPPLNTSDAHSSDTTASKQGRPPLEIDLNVADETVLEDMASSPGSPHTTGSVSGVVGSNHDAPTRSAGGLDLDLNKVDEGTDTGQFLGSSSCKKPFSGGLHNGDINLFRGFDLNNGPGIDEIVEVEPLPKSQYVKNSNSSMPFLPPVAGLRMGNSAEIGNISSWYSHGNSYGAVPFPSFLPERGAQHPYPIVAAPGARRILGSAGGSISGDVYRGPVLSSAPAMAFSPAAPFPYAGFPFGSNFPLPLSSYSGGPTTYVDSSQLVQPGNAVSSHYVRPYILSLPEGSMNAGSESIRKWGGQGLDLNAGPGSMDVADVKDGRLLSASRQLSLPSSQMFGEEQARMYQVSGGGGVKRKEREGSGSWDERLYRQPSWQ